MENSFETLPKSVSQIHEKLDKIEKLLLSKEQVKSSDKLLTVKQAAEFLSIAVSTLYGLNMKGEIPMMKISKRCYYSEKDLLEYLKNSKTKSKAELEKDVDDYLNKNKRK
jgi:excisionase family DNA binding protein